MPRGLLRRSLVTIAGMAEFFATLTVPPPDVSSRTAEAIALERWGISARA
jgi:hypothetical protein